MRAACVLGFSLIGCAPSPAPRPQPLAEPAQQGSAASGDAAPRASNDAPSAGADEPEPLAAERADVDPSSIQGYVRGMAGPDVAAFEGKVTALESRPIDEYVADLRLDITDARGVAHRFQLIVPRALPLPFAVGARVRYRGSADGGGPNRRLALLLTAADGSTLFAIDMAPEGWKIERGKRTSSDHRETTYAEHAHAVVFEHAGTKLELAGGAWARLGDYYIWGNAAVRTPKSARLPRDYVGDWLDSAVVRAR
jgi:hypothetical protein